jgi:competence protein ComEA
MEGSSATAWAGFVVAWGLFVVALPRAAEQPAACPHPVLREPAVIECVLESAPRPRLAGPTRRLFDLPVDPNRADPVTLETLPGIGPARARAIVAERSSRPFASLADLRRVYGLGPVRVAALAPYLAFSGPLAVGDVPSVKSPTCRSSCGNAPAGAVSGEVPQGAAEEGP